MSAGNFRGGRKPFPKPSAFESEIHPTHKPDGLCSGDFALPGANLRLRKFTVRKSQTVFLHAAPKDGAHGCCCCRRLHFGANTQQHLGTSQKSPLWLSEIGSRELLGYGYRFAISRPMAAAHRENGGIGLSTKGRENRICEKKFIYRNGEAP